MRIVIPVEDAIVLARGVFDIEDKEYFKRQHDFIKIKGQLIDKYGREAFNKIVNKMADFDFDFVYLVR